MPAYRLGPNRWRVVVFVQGERRDRVVQGSKRDAEEYEARLRVELSAVDLRAARATPTFSDFCRDVYAPHAAMHFRGGTWKRSRRYVVAELMRRLGDLKLNEIRTDVVEAYKRGRLDEGRLGATINGEVRTLRRILNIARERGYQVTSAAFHALPERGSRKQDAWSLEELQRLFAKLDELSPAIIPLVTFLVNTGARRCEGLALTWEHVDLPRGQILIWPNEEWRPKNGLPREVPIADALLGHLRGPRTSRFVYPCPGTGDRYAVWPQLQFDRARKAAGLKGGPHRLRHTYATHFLARCPDLYLLAKILGHSDAEVTRRYAHLLPDHLARARNVVSIAPAPKTLHETLHGGVVAIETKRGSL